MFAWLLLFAVNGSKTGRPWASSNGHTLKLHATGLNWFLFNLTTAISNTLRTIAIRSSCSCGAFQRIVFVNWRLLKNSEFVMQRPWGLALQLKVSPLVLVPSSTGAAWRSFVTTVAQVLEKLQHQLILTTVRAPSPRLYGQRPPSEAPWRSSRRHPPCL